MRVTIETAAPGMFRVTHERDGQIRTRELVSRKEAEVLVTVLLDQDNRRNRVSDRVPLLDRTITVRVPSWFPWPRKRPT